MPTIAAANETLSLVVPDATHAPLYAQTLQQIAKLEPFKAQAIQKDLADLSADPDSFMQNLHGDEEEQNYFLMDDGKIVGLFSFRPVLDEVLENFGGHVGFGIDPAQRNKGYATKGLGLVKQLAREHGLDELILTCAIDNEPSEIVIERNGGVYHGLVEDLNGRGPNKKFVISL